MQKIIDWQEAREILACSGVGFSNLERQGLIKPVELAGDNNFYLKEDVLKLKVKSAAAFVMERTSQINYELPCNVKNEQILTDDEFKKYKEHNKIMIEEITENGTYHGYRFLTICFRDDTADEVFIKTND